MTDEYLIEHGYKKYEPTYFDNKSVVARFQKRFNDDIGKKYFIDIHKITHEWMREWDKKQSWYIPYSYEFSCQLYKKDTHAAVNMQFFSDWTIEQVEEFVERLFQNGELDYYERWNE